MNELVVARQLETSMTKLKGKGFNFRVSKVDLNRAKYNRTKHERRSCKKNEIK